ncbi:MAG TPA: DMT family transporter [Ilumatobacteraceae bacterium]|jgi:drug/metabolite transporter (DMT)-like permease
MTATATTPATVTRIPFGASLMALGAGVVWSFGAVTARLAKHADAFQYLIWRSVGVLIVMEVMTAIRRQPPLLPKAFNSGKWMLSADFGLLLASLMFVYAVKTTTAANASFLGSVTPLAAVVLARLVLGERLSRVTLGAIVVAFVGLIVTVFGDLHAGNMTGNIAALTASVGFAIYTISVRSDPQADWSPVLPGYAAAMIVLCSVITLLHGKTLFPPAKDMAYAIGHGAVFIVVGTKLFNRGSRTVPAVPMTVFAQTEMVFVPLWAFLVLSEAPKPATIVGGAIIFAAVVGKAVLDTTPGAVQPVQEY